MSLQHLHCADTGHPLNSIIRIGSNILEYKYAYWRLRMLLSHALLRAYELKQPDYNADVICAGIT